MTEHQRRVIEVYKSGLSLRDTGDHFGISYKRVWAIIREGEPTALRGAHVVLGARCLWPQTPRLKQNWFHWYMRNDESTVSRETTVSESTCQKNKLAIT